MSPPPQQLSPSSLPAQPAAAPGDKAPGGLPRTPTAAGAAVGRPGHQRPRRSEGEGEMEVQGQREMVVVAGGAAQGRGVTWEGVGQVDFK